MSTSSASSSETSLHQPLMADSVETDETIELQDVVRRGEASRLRRRQRVRLRPAPTQHRAWLVEEGFTPEISCVDKTEQEPLQSHVVRCGSGWDYSEEPYRPNPLPWLSSRESEESSGIEKRRKKTGCGAIVSFRVLAGSKGLLATSDERGALTIVLHAPGSRRLDCGCKWDSVECVHCSHTLGSVHRPCSTCSSKSTSTIYYSLNPSALTTNPPFAPRTSSSRHSAQFAERVRSSWRSTPYSSRPNSLLRGAITHSPSPIGESVNAAVQTTSYTRTRADSDASDDSGLDVPQTNVSRHSFVGPLGWDHGQPLTREAVMVYLRALAEQPINLPSPAPLPAPIPSAESPQRERQPEASTSTTHRPEPRQPEPLPRLQLRASYLIEPPPLSPEKVD